MSAQANLSLNSVTFVPTGVSGRVAGWIYRSDGVPSGFQEVSISLPNPSGTAKVYRLTAKLSVPTVQAEDTDCACAGDVLRTGNVTIEALLPLTSTTAERTDLLEKLQDLVADTQFVSAIENLVLPTS
jgi:hypothetical protein